MKRMWWTLKGSVGDEEEVGLLRVRLKAKKQGSELSWHVSL